MSAERPFPRSICHGCVHLRLVTSGKGSVFLMCQEPSLPKYPPQPIVRCGRFTPPAPGSSGAPAGGGG